MTQVRLSSFSRPARPMQPRLSGSSHSPSPRNAQTRTSSVVGQPAVAQVAVVPGVVDRHDRAEAHADGRELPEVGHQPRVRVAATARRPAAAPGGSSSAAARSSRPSRKARAYMPGLAWPWKKMTSPGWSSVRPRKKWLKPISYSVAATGEGGDVPADVGRLVRLEHHRHRVPADDALDLPFEVPVAGERDFLVLRDRVHVRGGDAERDVHAGGPGLALEGVEEELGPLRPLDPEDGFQRLQPLGGFQRVVVVLNRRGKGEVFGPNDHRELLPAGWTRNDRVGRRARPRTGDRERIAPVIIGG